MFSIKILKQEIEFLNMRLNALVKSSYSDDPHACLEIQDLKMLITDIEDSIAFLKEKRLIIK